jgi:hypothetical protein
MAVPFETSVTYRSMTRRLVPEEPISQPPHRGKHKDSAFFRCVSFKDGLGMLHVLGRLGI